ncbi:porin [Thalassospira sp. CH_XMU1448-2]|uniref:porin n=1 Tax=Thalassospira sp. CH_XMU1448-2 TaxID=3107773 RepID=UPI00300AA4E2
MKKILVASSALVAVAFAGQAQASEKISLSVSGFMNQHVGYADVDKNLGNRHNFQQSNTEVHFKGATTLDNGIEVGASIELEGEVAGVDEQYLYINGGFGQVKLGSEDGAANDMVISAPKAGAISPNDDDFTNWGANNTADVWTDASSDDMKITYYTPSLGGFRAGVSYTDSTASEGSDAKELSGFEKSVLSAGAEYRGDFDGVSFAISAAGESTSPREGSSAITNYNPKTGKSYAIGTNVGFGNFTVGGSFGHSDEDFNATRATAGTVSGATEKTGYDLGVSYSMDAATVALTYAYTDREAYAGSASGNLVRNASSDLEVQGVSLGMNYTLGAGVTWVSSLFWNEEDAATAAQDGEVYGIVTGLNLSF